MLTSPPAEILEMSLNLRFSQDDISNIFQYFTDTWEKRQLGEIGQFIRLSVNPQESPNDIFREYSMPAFDNRQTPNVVLGSTMHSNRLKMIDNILLINKLNVRQRRIWLVKKAGENAVSSSEFMPFIPNDVNLEFLKQVFLSDKVTKKLENISSGTSNSQKRITPLDMLDYLLEKPEDVQEQVKIGTLFAHLDTLITVNQRTTIPIFPNQNSTLSLRFHPPSALN